jgi:hypothetical protein
VLEIRPVASPIESEVDELVLETMRLSVTISPSSLSILLGKRLPRTLALPLPLEANWILGSN